MNNMQRYNIDNTISPNDIKAFRKRLGLSQAEFANMLGISRPTAERNELSESEIKGPISVLINLLSDNIDIITNRIIPDKKYPLRLWYMYKNKKCTLIDVDELNQKVFIKNYVSNIMYCAFGNNLNPNYEDYEEFLKSRCFPETRDKMKIELEALNIPFYDPMLIIEKTGGHMAEDDFWIMIDK